MSNSYLKIVREDNYKKKKNCIQNESGGPQYYTELPTKKWRKSLDPY